MTPDELTIVTRALRARSQVCNTLAWEAKQGGREEAGSRLRDEAATCLNLISKFKAEARPQTALGYTYRSPIK
jgi:molybdenum-dependent DNA-binding transcriptional regulator ModE